MSNHTDRQEYIRNGRSDRRGRDDRYGRDDIAERMAFQPTAFEKKLRRGRDDRRRGRDDRREPLMTQTFSGIHNSIRGLAIGRKGAIQKLVTGRGIRDVGFMLERYSVEDDTIPGFFKIVIRGTARDVLCAQRFIFNHVSAWCKKAGEAVLPTDSRVVWVYDDELKSFVMELKDAPPTYDPSNGLAAMRARSTPVPAVPPPDKTANKTSAAWTASGPEIIAAALAQSMAEAGMDASSADDCAQHRREAERALGETLPPNCVRTQSWVAEGGLAAWIAPVPQDNE